MPARAAIFILFFISGAVALVYEVLWLRMLILIFGSTQFAVSTILTAFMSGLALGSFLFGRFVDRHRNPVAL
jgi:spermidine synthase